jgi:hypothetical protein
MSRKALLFYHIGSVNPDFVDRTGVNNVLLRIMKNPSTQHKLVKSDSIYRAKYCVKYYKDGRSKIELYSYGFFVTEVDESKFWRHNFRYANIILVKRCYNNSRRQWANDVVYYRAGDSNVS